MIDFFQNLEAKKKERTIAHTGTLTQFVSQYALKSVRTIKPDKN